MRIHKPVSVITDAATRLQRRYLEAKARIASLRRGSGRRAGLFETSGSVPIAHQ
jgi:hypothetical protein